MRSRTEMVTTTFVDSEEEQSDDDSGSEDDWRPTSSNKKRNLKNKSRRSKRKAAKTKKKKYSESNEEEEDDDDDDPSLDDDSDDGYQVVIRPTTSMSHLIGMPPVVPPHPVQTEVSAAISPGILSLNRGLSAPGATVSRARPPLIAAPTLAAAAAAAISANSALKLSSGSAANSLANIKFSLPIRMGGAESDDDRFGSFKLYLCKKDLNGDYKTNNHLCLWCREENTASLLQKYIRVKTGNTEEFIFTSSSVYANWDENQRDDYLPIDVKYFEGNHKRVQIVDLNLLHATAAEQIDLKKQAEAAAPAAASTAENTDAGDDGGTDPSETVQSDPGEIIAEENVGGEN